MSNQTYETQIHKKITWTAAGEKTFVFNNPSDANAFEYEDYNGDTKKSNQNFTEIFINNISSHSCYFATNPNYVAAPVTADGVQAVLTKDGANFTRPAFKVLRIYLAGAGDVYITLTK